MNQELKETVLKVAEYSNEEKKRSTRVVLIYFVLGIIALVSNLAMEFMELPDSFFVGFLEGSTISLAIGAMVLGILYATGILNKAFAFKRRLLGKESSFLLPIGMLCGAIGNLIHGIFTYKQKQQK